MKKSILILLLLMITTLSVRADQFNLEPSLGLVAGDFEQQFTNMSGTRNGTTYSGNTLVLGDVTGIDFGLKGYLNELDIDYMKFVFIGFDFAVSSLSFVPLDFFGPSSEYDAGRASIGGLIGLDWGSKWIPRVWVVYIPMDSLVITDSGGNENNYLGSGYKIGISFGSKLKVNFEYTSRSYSERDKSSLPKTYTTDGVTLTEEKLESSGLILSLSYPLNI
ncbi:MAG: hypothetical protein HN353_13435 [Bdellovibrionales bacterium]|jgi:hypothetical protein|nr:hypothetical protein [Bdellovibrionales bacterium]MBT3524905.1 hypothetical protein [Bdellovibrionales bacterium]MBT7668103.1 hypothetical protein [Bdellovibrionales bacterium]MBT7766799.1 hypothetical protein [Bdellovibrionales bacterium]